MPGRKLPRFIATALVCVLMGVVIYRAKTQSFTIDEAFTFNLFVDRGLDQFLLVYDACNHVLHTLLTKFVRRGLGTSELVLRLPSLFGALLYFIVVRRLCRIAAGSGWTHVIGIAALGLNPLVLDYLVAARGYGLALALFLWSVYYAVRWLNEGGEVSLLRRAGVAAGLSIAANLTLVVPVAALGTALLLRGKQRWNVIDGFGGPALVIAFLFVALPLTRAKSDNFYLGTGTMNEAIASLSSGLPVPGLLLVFALITASALVIWQRGSHNLTSDLFLLSSLTLALSLAALVAMHRLLLVPYPFERTGLYLIPLFGLSLIAGLRPLGYPGAACLAAVALFFAAQFNTRYFPVWRFDASTNRVMDAIVKDNEMQGRPQFTVASTSVYGETLKYYRKRRKLHRMAPEIAPEEARADYYVLVASRRGLVDKLGLRVIMQDDVSGAMVAGRL